MDVVQFSQLEVLFDVALVAPLDVLFDPYLLSRRAFLVFSRSAIDKKRDHFFTIIHHMETFKKQGTHRTYFLDPDRFPTSKLFIKFQANVSQLLSIRYFIRLRQAFMAKTSS